MRIQLRLRCPVSIHELEEFIEVVKAAREGWRGPQPNVDISFGVTHDVAGSGELPSIYAVITPTNNQTKDTNNDRR